MKSVAVVLLGIVIGCGGTGKDGGTTPNGGGSGSGASKPAAAGDVSLDIPVTEIKGIIFEPEALGRPGMPTVPFTGKKPTIEAQKKKFGAERDVLNKQAYGVQLVTLLFEESKKKTGDEQKKLILEARQVLRDLQALSKDKVDEYTLLFLGLYEIDAIVEFKDGEWATAEKAWEGLVQKFPKTKNNQSNKAWWAYTLLKQYKNAEALAVVKNDAPNPSDPELAYVTAWAKWRAGDDAGAWQAIVVAATGWAKDMAKDPTFAKLVTRDLMLFASRSSAGFAEVSAKLYNVLGAKAPAQQFDIAKTLGIEAFQFAGKWNDAVAAIEEALKLGGATIQPNDKITLKFWEASFTVPLDQPASAARNALDALKAMPACTKCSQQDKENVVTQIYQMARVFHLLYATANDIRYFQPAHDLYVETIPLIANTATRTQAKADLDTLDKTLKNTKAGTGTHEKQAIGVLMQRHTQEIKACYEETLAANPKLAGTITLTLESDASGDIKGASSDPKAGAADMSLVAGCAVAAAKTWKLPKRGMAGSTRIKLVYQLSKQ